MRSDQDLSMQLFTDMWSLWHIITVGQKGCSAATYVRRITAAIFRQVSFSTPSSNKNQNTTEILTFSRMSTVSVWPYCAAQCNAVSPSSFYKTVNEQSVKKCTKFLRDTYGSYILHDTGRGTGTQNDRFRHYTFRSTFMHLLYTLQRGRDGEQDRALMGSIPIFLILIPVPFPVPCSVQESLHLK